MRPCPICSHTQPALIGELALTFVGPMTRTSYDLAHCKECDLIYLSPLPLAVDLDEIYKNTPQFDYHSDEKSAPIVAFYTDRLRALVSALGKPANLSVLEIGAGPAWVTRAAKSLRANARTVAQDVTAEMAGKCPWVDHYIVDTTEAQELDRLGPYDVISLTHVIEHVPDPVQTLRRAAQLSRGLIFVTAPHRPVEWKGTIEEWRKYSYNHVPAHLQYFSEKAMTAAAERAGLRVRHWDATGEEGQSFEAWLQSITQPATEPVEKIVRKTGFASLLGNLSKKVLR